MPNLETFRQETRSCLEVNCPESMRQPDPGSKEAFYGGRQPTFINDDQRIWFERMVEKGWTVPQWPQEYGGAGLNDEEQKVLSEEMSRLGCRPPLVGFGIWMLSPVLFKYGNDEQKRKFLPQIARGEVRWYQGYSEPGAGSDLASLAMRAASDGDDYVVTGSKIWTTYANLADAIFCLVRTDPDAPKHRGISFLLIEDIRVPEVQISPIELINGHSPFCETHFDGVRVPKKNRIGEENQGWTIAMNLLQHERTGIGLGHVSSGISMRDVALESVGLDETGKLRNPILRQELARLEIRGEAIRATGERVAEESKSGQGPGHASAALKYTSTEWNKSRYELLMSLAGFSGLGWEGEQFQEGDLSRAWLRTKANTIEGGTSEIQLNIISKRILGLPMGG
ncbi:acyl-CoA dehydrogenase family protein [Chloroflexi bacterium TSY]|nr:acyl-CoA dehydrogenase family protein [Chloroflexi bacterium TSY]